MSRRSHRKSRTGCVDCKKRHIKCDETLPSCINCRTAQRECSFISQSSTPPPTSTRICPIPNSNPVEPAAFGGDQLPPTEQQYVVNIEHTYLLCHFCTETVKDFPPGRVYTDDPFRILQEHSLSSPFLLQQVLAVSALHLSLLRPIQKDYYRRYASGLQAHALSLFNSNVTKIDKDNCAATIVFSSLVAVHALGETLIHRKSNLNTFLDHLLHSIQLHRGVWIMVTGASDLLRQTGLEPYLSFSARIVESKSTGPECDVLRQMVREADTGPKSAEVYQHAIKHLQWAFDVDRYTKNTTEANHMLFAWIILVPPEYTELLIQRRPEALIILAHYGIILFRHRDLWLIGNGADFLIRSISDFLGSYWERWLAWPNAEIREHGVPSNT